MQKKKRKLNHIGRQLITFTSPRSHVSEQYRTLRTNIKFSSPDSDYRSIVITSASPGEGKSTTSANLAVVFAQEGRRVLIVDGDMRKPTMHHTFNVSNTRGLSSVLTRQSLLKTAIKPTKVENLDILACGPIPPNPAELLGSKSMDAVFAELKEMYDLIIVDAPPILSVTDGQILANKCEGTILVINSGETEKEKAIKAKELITQSKSRLIGAILNNYVLPRNSDYLVYYGNDN